MSSLYYYSTGCSNQPSISKSTFLKHIHIRLFRKSDIDSIRHLFDVSFPIVYTDSYFESISSQFFRGNRLTTYVIEYLNGDEPNLIGCIIMQSQLLDGSIDNSPIINEPYLFDHLIYIQNIAILPEYRRYGLGSFLISMCISLFEKEDTCAGIYLHVQSSNKGNIQFYEKNGFKKVCHIDNMYLINDKWEDGDMYFYSYHGATAIYNSTNSSGNSSLYFISAVSILLFGIFTIYNYCNSYG